MLQKEVIEAGEKIASDLIDAQVSKNMGSMGGHVIKDVSEYDNSDLIQKYLDNEIVSVEAIYIAMKRVEEKFTSTNSANTQLFTIDQIIEVLEDSDHLDDARMHFNQLRVLPVGFQAV